MKACVFFFMLILSQWHLSAQELDLTETNSKGVSAGFINNKFGIYNKDKKELATPVYDVINLADDFFITELNGKKGLFSPVGAELLKPMYDDIEVESGKRQEVILDLNGKKYLWMNDKVVYSSYSCNVHQPLFFAGQSEVSIAEYLAYVLTITENVPSVYQSSPYWPDTSKMAPNGKLIFRKLMGVSDDMVYSKEWTDYKVKHNGKTTIRLPVSILNDKKLTEFLNLPVTGVSYKQANEYLEWYAARVNDYCASMYAYRLRLPTPQEWSAFALDGLRSQNKAYGILDSLNDKKCMLYNTIPNKEVCSNFAEKEKKFGDNITPVFSYNPDLNGLYQVFGNVAEMTSIEGVAKGGSYTHYANQSRISEQQEYNGPQPWLGFRWVVEILP